MFGDVEVIDCNYFTEYTHNSVNKYTRKYEFLIVFTLAKVQPMKCTF